MKCYCDSELDYSACCEPCHLGSGAALTPVALMRSRYSAHACGRIEYLTQTNHPETREARDAEELRAIGRKTEWLGLEIVNHESNPENPDEGFVSFRAKYRMEGLLREHRERSRFLKVEGQWFFHSGQIGSLVENKVGRNDPCPCGSGKKHKKCCG